MDSGTIETAGVDCAETEAAGLFSELTQDTTSPLLVKAKSAPPK